MEQKEILDAAAVHKYNLDRYQHPQLKFAYMGGAMDAAAMQQTGGQDPAAGGAIGGGASIPGAEDGQASVEQIIAVIQQAADSGQIPPDVAMQAIQDLQSQAAGGGDPSQQGGAPGGMPPGGAPDPSQDPTAPPQAKAASALLKTLTAAAPAK